jgi:hypothetical protein
MKTRLHPDCCGPATGGCRLRPLLGALCLLLLGWGSALPANAESGTINGPRTGPITVNAGETLNIVAGAQITGGGLDGVVNVEDGTVNISGGSISASNTASTGVIVNSGTVNITGGSISADFTSGSGVWVRGGAVNITGGSIYSGNNLGGVSVEGGTVYVSGGRIAGVVRGLSVEGGTATIAGGEISGGTNGDDARTAEVVGDGTLTITGGSITENVVFADGDGATLTITGGSIPIGVLVRRATVNVTGGSIGEFGVNVEGGTANISGGSIAALMVGAQDAGGTAILTGCGLHLSADGQLIGTLQDGTPINAPTVLGPAANLILQNTPPQITCPASVSVPQEPGHCGAHISIIATASSACAGAPLSASGVRSDSKALTDLYPVGTTTVTWTATDAAGLQATCTQTLTVTPTPPVPVAQLRQALQAGSAQVQQLVAAGTLRPAEGAVLTGALNLALQVVNRRADYLTAQDVAAVRQFLTSFISGVNQLMSQGRLPAAKGQALIAVAQSILNALGTPCP